MHVKTTFYCDIKTIMFFQFYESAENVLADEVLTIPSQRQSVSETKELGYFVFFALEVQCEALMESIVRYS